MSAISLFKKNIYIYSICRRYKKSSMDSNTLCALTKVTSRAGGKLVSDRVIGNTLDRVIVTTDKHRKEKKKKEMEEYILLRIT